MLSKISCQELTIRNLHKDLILMQKINTCKIQTGNIRIIHPINLTDLEITINQLTSLVYNKEKNNNVLTQIGKHKIRELYSNFLQIKPVTHKRTKRWDIIGTTWKWIAGSPDAQDLRIIDRSLNQLVEENNHQIKINKQIGDSISELTSAINQIIEKQHINQIVLDEIDVITTLLNIDTINKILINIQEAILFAKMHVTNSKMLSSKEIHLVKTILNNQGVEIEIPEEALNLVTPKMVANTNTLLYILHVPELEPEEGTILRIYPVNQNDTVIKNYPQFIIKQNKQLLTTSKPENYVQLHIYTKEFKDSCIHPLIMGNEPHCVMESNEDTSAQLISNNKVLITNAKNQELRSNCGPTNRHLYGNFVISFSNCTIIFKGQNFTSMEKISEMETYQGALHDLIINKEISKNHDVAKIEEVALSNRNALDKVSLQQESDQKWIWSLVGGTSLSSTLLIIILFLIYFHLRTIQQKASRRIQRRKMSLPKSNDTSTEIQHNQASAEDDTFSPPR